MLSFGSTDGSSGFRFCSVDFQLADCSVRQYGNAGSCARRDVGGACLPDMMDAPGVFTANAVKNKGRGGSVAVADAGVGDKRLWDNMDGIGSLPQSLRRLLVQISVLLMQVYLIAIALIGLGLMQSLLRAE